MKTALILALMAISTMAQAERINETKDESRNRQQAGQYQQYENRGNHPPLGGYVQRLGESRSLHAYPPPGINPATISNPYRWQED